MLQVLEMVKTSRAYDKIETHEFSNWNKLIGGVGQIQRGIFQSFIQRWPYFISSLSKSTKINLLSYHLLFINFGEI